MNSFRKTIEKHQALSFSLILTLLAAIYFCATWQKDVGILLFTMRDYLRASGLLEGQWIWHGPELNMGGYLPGPFFYYLQAAVLLFHHKIMSVVFLCYLLQGLSIFLMSFWLSKRFNFSAAIISVALLLSSPVLNTNFHKIWNPSFLLFFIVLSFILIQEGFRQKKHHYLYGALILTSLGIQIHFTALYNLLFFLLPSLNSSPEGGAIGFTKKQILFMVMAFFLPMAPFAIWVISKSTPQTVQLFWESQAQNIVMNNTIAEGTRVWKNIFKSLNWLWVFNPLTFLLVNKLFGEKKLSAETKGLLWLTIILFGLNFLPFYNKFRYILVFQFIYILLISALASKCTENKKLLAGLFLALLASLTFVYKDHPETDAKKLYVKVIKNFNEPQNLHKTLQILDYIYKETGWSPTQFEDKTFQLIAGMFEYSSVYSEHFKGKTFKPTNKYDGVLILPYFAELEERPVKILGKMDIRENIDNFFQNNTFLPKIKKRFDDVMVVFYKLESTTLVDVPHNVGNIYQIRPLEKYIDSLEMAPGKARIAKFKGKSLAVWNISKGSHYKRRLAFHFEDGQLVLNSHTLRISNNYVDNFFDELFIYKLRVQIKSQNKVETIHFPPFLGHTKIDHFAPKAILEDLGLNQYFISAVTPIRRTFKWDCSIKPQQLIIQADYISTSRFRSTMLESEQKNVVKVVDISALQICAD